MIFNNLHKNLHTKLSQETYCHIWYMLSGKNKLTKNTHFVSVAEVDVGGCYKVIIIIYHIFMIYNINWDILICDND